MLQSIINVEGKNLVFQTHLGEIVGQISCSRNGTLAGKRLTYW